MAEEKIKNLFIGTSYENENYFIDSIDLNNNINKALLSNFILQKDNLISYDNNINIQDYDYKSIIDKIDINEIEKKFKKVVENFYNIVDLIENKIKKLKERNEEQIKLIKIIILEYKFALNSNNLNCQLTLNTKNILKFNQIDNNDLINIFEYNILKSYPIEHYIKESISIPKFQKILKLKFNERITLIIYYEKMNKYIIYSDENIYLINPKTYVIEDQIKTNKELLALNLMKDKETIFISFENSIKKLKIINNKLIIEDYLNYISIDDIGKIIDYKNDIAWMNESSIFINKGKEELLVFEENNEDYLEKKQMIEVKNILEYNDNNEDILLYIYLYSDYSYGYESFHFNYFKNNNKNNKNDIIFEEGQEIFFDESINTYNLYKYKKNEIIVICKEEIDVINFEKMNIILTIKPKKYFSINNSYFLLNSYLMIFFNANNHNLYKGEYDEKNNIIIIKIKDGFKQIILDKNLETEKNGNLYFLTSQNMNSDLLISVTDNKEIIFNEICFNFNKTLDLKKKNK